MLAQDGQCFLVIKRPRCLKYPSGLDQLDRESSPAVDDTGDEIDEDGDAVSSLMACTRAHAHITVRDASGKKACQMTVRHMMITLSSNIISS